MSRRDAPKLEPRRTQDFAAELSARARAWMPSWALEENEGDFGGALLQVAARFNAEVAERLDGAGGKLRDGLFDWLGVHGEAARPARVPVAFKLGDKAIDPVLASAPVRLTADVDGAPVVFETETDVQVVPAKLESVVFVEGDKIFLPPPGMTSLEPQSPVPTEWTLKSFAAPGATRLQLDPAEGLAKEIMLSSDGQQFRIVSPDKGLVTIATPLLEGLPQDTVVRKVKAFDAYGGQWVDEQAHILYIGSTTLLDIESAATIDIVGAQGLTDVDWAYWGKNDKAETPDAIDWQPLEPAKVQRPDALVLDKSKGAVELREIDGKPSRWIRGVAAQGIRDVKLAVDFLGVRVNYEKPRKTCQEPAGTPPAAVDAMANTTPLVLSTAFYPLGREPRQFDAFYIASTEAFSKPGADVQLCFEMADLSFKTLACLRTANVLAGITRDGGLQLLSITNGSLARFNGRAPLHPPSPDAAGGVVAAPPVELRSDAMAIWDREPGVSVAATADNAVWLWNEVAPELGTSGWTALPPFAAPPAGQAPPPIDGLVYDSKRKTLLALRDGRLFSYDPKGNSTDWTSVAAKAGTEVVTLARIAPIQVDPAATSAQRVVGVAADGTVYAIELTAAPIKAVCVQLMTGADTDVAPAAILRSDNSIVAVARETDGGVTSFLGSNTKAGAVTTRVSFDGLRPIESFGIDAAIADGHGVFSATAIDAAGVTRLLRWSPHEGSDPALLFNTPIPRNLGPAAGTPIVLPTHVVAPALSNQVLVAGFDPKKSIERKAPLLTAIVTAPSPDDPLTDKDQVAFPDGQGFKIESAAFVAEKGDVRLLAYKAQTTDSNVIVYPPAVDAQPSAFVSATPDVVQIPSGPVIPNQTKVLIQTNTSMQVYLVKSAVGSKVTLTRSLDHTSPGPVSYWLPRPDPTPNKRRILPLLETNPTTTSGDWEADLLDRVPLAFQSATPIWQRAHAFDVDGDGHPKLVLLDSMFTKLPAIDAQGAGFITDALDSWTGQLADTTSNPKLSWEYWNGTGWWTLGNPDVDTLHLKRSGSVRFTVPDDLRPTDWSGKTSHWIRARLVGGDYGRAEITVSITKTKDPNVTKQSFEPDPSTIRAPYVASMRVSYSMPLPVLPTYVVAQDSGSMRDQSDANRTPQAIVEAFVPLPVTLGRLMTPAAGDDDTEACPPPCDCGQSPTIGASGAMQTTPPATPPVLSDGRALFLGFRGALAEQPIRLFLRVREDTMQELRTAMHVEALVADRFLTLVAEDGTRALSESGVLTLAFDDAPTPRDLFGKPLRWLRITPPQTLTTPWRPVLQGAYINASWATAAETMKYERVGSSVGAPSLALGLARPPVLRDTLELRVREPLGDEERASLREGDEKRVVNDLVDLPGDWVRWEQVFDPADEDASARVYSLDEATGEIVFGDSEHGMIPPIGQDNIVAFRYQRTERTPDNSDRVPANAVAVGAKLNLASPVAGVEAVFAADQAAGGAPPESPARVLRFGGARMRHRNRAVTLADLEDLALQTSPAIAQARCVPKADGLRLVIAMGGGSAQPTIAQQRALLRALTPYAPVVLANDRALRIAGPTERALDLTLQLTVDSLDDAGAVAQAVRARLTAWFDPVAGGARKEGWPMGRSPNPSDIALALVDTPRLRGVSSILLREAREAGRVGAWPASLRATDLVVLRVDAVHLQFTTPDAGA